MLIKIDEFCKFIWPLKYFNIVYKLLLEGEDQPFTAYNSSGSVIIRNNSNWLQKNHLIQNQKHMKELEENSNCLVNALATISLEIFVFIYYRFYYTQVTVKVIPDNY